MRWNYIDGLRGLAMVMVVYHHVMLRIFETSSFVSDMCVYWRMPLFFFISGFLSADFYDEILAKKRIANRLRYQLLPTMIMAITYCVIFNADLYGMILSPTKYGFWFPFALAQLSIGYISLSWLMNKYSLTKRLQISILAAVAIILLVIRITIVYNPNPEIKKLLDIFTLRESIYFSFYFFLGVFARYFQKRWCAFSINWWVLAICSSVFLIECKGWDYDLPMPYFKGILGIIIAWGVFYHLHSLAGHTQIMKTLRIIGQNTLPIYLLHYFIIRLIIPIASFHVFNSEYQIIQQAIYLLLTAATVGAAYYLSEYAKKWPMVYKVALGRPYTSK